MDKKKFSLTKLHKEDYIKVFSADFYTFCQQMKYEKMNGLWLLFHLVFIFVCITSFVSLQIVWNEKLIHGNIIKMNDIDSINDVLF